MAEKYLTKSGLVTVKNEIDAKYQKKEANKGLSANDYTDADKAKLAGIATGAEVNTIQGITVNGEEQTPATGTRAINLVIPSKASDLTNDAGYQTKSEVDTAITGKGYQTASDVEKTITGKGYQTASEVQATVNAAIASVNGVDFAIVDTLPTNGKAGTFYLVGNGGASGNVYDEYVYITKKDGTKSYEKIGTTDVDMTGYVKTSDIAAITNDEIDEIFNA